MTTTPMNTTMTHDCKTCPVSTGTHKPAEALHQIAEPAAPVGKPIKDAIDALVMAAFTEGGCSEHRMSEARIQTELRKKELCALLSTPQPCSRSHPHEEMTPMCELRTEIARLTNALARAEAAQHDRIAELESQVQRAAEAERAAILLRIKNRAAAGALLVKDFQAIVNDRGPAQQAVQAAVPKWIDDPHDIEQGQMLNPEWVKLQQSDAPAHPAEGVPAQAVQASEGIEHVAVMEHPEWMLVHKETGAQKPLDSQWTVRATQPAAQGAATTGYIAPKGRYVPPVLFSPYTGEPRDARDIASDPRGILIVPPGAALAAQAKQGGA